MTKRPEEGTPHPLFPVQDGDPIPVIHSILVARFNPARQKLEYCKHAFAPEELTDLEELDEMFGGGSYTLKARGPDDKGNPNCWYACESHWDLPGPSKPLSQEAGQEPAKSAVAAPPASGGELGGSAMVQLMLGIFSLMGQQTQQTTQLLLGILQNGREDSRAFVQSMQAANQAHTESMARLMQAITEAQGKGSGGVEQVLEAIRTGIELRQGASEGEGTPTELESVVQGLTAAAEISKLAAGGGPPIPPNGGQSAP